jgi:hypothetical protein
MLTGIKPIESTNRKIEDSLVPPKEINPDIPVSLNNAILRAMAIDMHMRYSDVSDFLKAISGKKKVRTVEKEKKRRKASRWISVVTTVLLLAAGFGLFMYFYEQQRIEETLPDSSIEFWYILPDDTLSGSAKTNSYEGIITAFTETFPNVEIILKAFSENEYSHAIDNAAQMNALPPLFESSAMDDTVLSSAQSAQTALNLVDLSSVLFLKEYIGSNSQSKQFPLGFSVPVRFTNLVPNPDAVSTGNKAVFLSGGAKEYMGSTADYFDVQLALTGKYAMEFIFEDEHDLILTDMLSIGNSDSDQLRVINRLLVYMLSEIAQDYLHIQHRSGSLPLNRYTLFNSADGYISIYEKFSDLRVLLN